ncbi:HipA domain-containing protein [Paracoccus alkanivorans]|uniref:HipA domain-containing protein n=1 Tax=Paracoccus alkanivorans TaxID=2116655 RepID=A0A3M0MLP7_9RHOB|nr:HipA domain-containing protein [Paracoccus alkanivorans]
MAFSLYQVPKPLQGFGGAALFVFGHEAVGIDDGGAALALQDIAAERERLTEGEPALAGKVTFDHRAPQKQHVDPRIAPAGRGILRKAERRFRRSRAPGLNPRHAACLQLGDDLVGDLGVEIGPVTPGAGVSLVSGHRGSPRRAPRASPSAFNPSRQTGPHSHSRGVVGCPRRRGRARLQARPQGKAFPSWVFQITIYAVPICGSLTSNQPISILSRFEDRETVFAAHKLTVCAWGYYTDIADVIRQISNKPVDDLHELWRRIVFTILVSNSDDHLKNHGFIYAGGDRWRLSPAFDINPSPSRHRVLETGIIQGGSFDASLDIALEACEFFELTPVDARQQAFQMAETIVSNWKQALRDEGASSDDLRTYADAFEHTESQKALWLNL